MTVRLPTHWPDDEPWSPAGRRLDETYEVYAVKYAERPANRTEHFVGGDPHDEPMDMDYFIWVIIERQLDPADQSPPRTFVVDTGFDLLDARRRNRNLVRSVPEALAAVGVEAATAKDVILTHLHYDHVGGYSHFPSAQFHVQDLEMSYASGRHMTQPALSHAYTPDHVADLVHLVYEGRVSFHDGESQLAPGLSLHLLGGHTMGLQVVRVATEIGWIVLASDASHYYENLTDGRPFPIVYNVGDMLEGHRRCIQLASSPDYVVPGHDPKVFDRYPAAGPGLEGIAVRLDVAPAT